MKIMNLNSVSYNFNAKETKDQCVQWIRDWFAVNGGTCNAIVGISGGKDSSVVAALCVEALGKDRVIGVLMPNGEQSDIADAQALVDYLGIKDIMINIADAYDDILIAMGELFNPQRDGYEEYEISNQTKINLAPRLRMSVLYAVAQSLNGRVMETSNLSETTMSWETRWGDAVGDCSPLGKLTVEEVKAIGYELGLPQELVDKVPSDGLCGSTDEEAMGVTYRAIDNYIRRNQVSEKDKEIIQDRMNKYAFKRQPIPVFDPGLYNFTK